MTLTLLLDLDDTLLDNDMETFVPAYLGALSAHMAAHCAPQKFSAALLAATQRMMGNLRPGRTLEETFAEAFYPALGLSPSALRADIEAFYREVFPSLQRVTRPRRAARPVVRAALERGWRVVVATNPLFPRTAVEQRLAWAGVPVDEFPYALVTSFEAFHFTKATPAYYAEVLGSLGWPPGPVLMVGNDPDLDLRPARKAGLPVFWVTASPAGEETPLPVDGRGPLEALLPWIESRPLSALEGRFETLEAALAVLRATPAVLDGWMRRLSASGRGPLLPGGEETWIAGLHRLGETDAGLDLPALEAALRKEGLSPAPVEPDTRTREEGESAALHAMRRFVETRRRLLNFLEALPAPALRHPVRQAAFGAGTLEEALMRMAGHDRMHLHSMHSLLWGAS